MWQYVSYSELYHYGIKGQKWGVRRFQNEDGSLTPAGKIRYDEPNKPKEQSTVKNKSAHRVKLEEKYKNAGLTDGEAERAAERRIKAEKYVAAAATVAVVAGVAYYKYRNYSKDMNFDVGTDFQRIISLTDKNQTITDGRQYVAINKLDKIKYRGLYAQELDRKTGNANTIYNVNVKAGQSIKVASRKNAEKVFKELYDNDDSFRNSMKDQINTFNLFGASPDKRLEKAVFKMRDDKKLSNSEYAKAYDYFNQRLTQNSEHSDKFYKELIKRGYNAVQDRNDQKYSGYNTKNPLILFDGKYEYTKVEMNKDQIQKDAVKGTLAILAPPLIKTGAAYTAMGVVGNKLEKEQSRAQTIKAVEQYKKEHPNTKMSDAEIEEMLK